MLLCGREEREKYDLLRSLFVSLQRLMLFKINGKGPGFSPMTMLLE
jgi:hypothetical protein